MAVAGRSTATPLSIGKSAMPYMCSENVLVMVRVNAHKAVCASTPGDLAAISGELCHYLLVELDIELRAPSLNFDPPFIEADG
jgi:hypothetical protein